MHARHSYIFLSIETELYLTSCICIVFNVTMMPLCGADTFLPFTTQAYDSPPLSTDPSDQLTLKNGAHLIHSVGLCIIDFFDRRRRSQVLTCRRIFWGLGTVCIDEETSNNVTSAQTRHACLVCLGIFTLSFARRLDGYLFRKGEPPKTAMVEVLVCMLSYAYCNAN